MDVLNPWIRCLVQRTHPSLRLFCFPYGGGGASIFRAWSDKLTDVEICPLQLPGREDRITESPFTSFNPLVRATAQAILPFLDVSFAFFGHSLGARISFEVARELRKQNGVLPSYLFVSACAAPQILTSTPAIHDLPEHKFLEEVNRRHIIPEALLRNRSFMQICLPTLRADFAVRESYVYGEEPPLRCPIAAFGGLSDNIATTEKLQAWRDQTTAGFTLHMLPGGHFFLDTSQWLLLEILRRAMSELVIANEN